MKKKKRKYNRVSEVNMPHLSEIKFLSNLFVQFNFTY